MSLIDRPGAWAKKLFALETAKAELTGEVYAEKVERLKG